MKPSVSRGNKKKPEPPVIVTSNNKINPKISERTLKKRQEAKENRYKKANAATGLGICGFIALYVFLVLCVIIGAGGVAVCIIYFNTDDTTKGWKIAGIVLSAITCILGIILILITICKQARHRRWRYKREIYITNDDEPSNSPNFDEKAENLTEARRETSASSAVFPISEVKVQASSTAVVPIKSSSQKATGDDLIYCPGCNRVHPSTHQCMYSTYFANSLATRNRSAVSPAVKDSIAIQTDDNDYMKKKVVPHTVIDRSLKYSHTTETQTDVSTNPRSNITESIVLRRVPIPTAKVVVQQPTTKVMIVKVPNTAGQLVIQPKTVSTDEQSK